MAVQELDPTFVRALKLLQSRSKDSTEQLRQIWHELTEQRKAELALKKGDGEDSQESRGSSSGGSSRQSKKDGSSEAKKREADKDAIEKCKNEIADLATDPPPAKRFKPDSGLAASSSSGAPRDSKSSGGGSERDRAKGQGAAEGGGGKETKPRERLREIEEDIFFAPQSQPASRMKDQRSAGDKAERDERDRPSVAWTTVARQQQQQQREKRSDPGNNTSSSFASDSDTEVSDDGGAGGVGGGGGAAVGGLTRGDEWGGETAIEGGSSGDDVLDLNSLSCVVCKAMNFTATNQLLECQDCHILCHQECHKPPVTDTVTDPRFVWYCLSCSKNLKKIAAKSAAQKKPTKAAPPIAARDAALTKQSRTEPAVQPFKRLETSKPTATKESLTAGSSGSGRGLSGLAGLAANLSAGRTSTDPGGARGPLSGVKPDTLRIPTLRGEPSTSKTSVAHGDAKVSGGKVVATQLRSSTDKGTTLKASGEGAKQSAPSSVASGSSRITAGISSTSSPSSSTNRTPTSSASSSNRTTASPGSIANKASALVVTPSAATANKATAAAAASTPVPVSAGGSGGAGGGGAVGAGVAGATKMTLMQSADKRLQQMKKKAAAKMVEKRTAK